MIDGAKEYLHVAQARRHPRGRRRTAPALMMDAASATVVSLGDAAEPSGKHSSAVPMRGGQNDWDTLPNTIMR